MSKKSIEQVAKSLLVELFDIQESSIRPDVHFKDDLDLDSIDLVDWIGRINDLYDLHLSPYDFEGCTQLKDFLAVVEEKHSHEGSTETE